MKTIQEVNGKSLSREQFGVFKTNWELRLGSEMFAALRIVSVFKSLGKVKAESAAGRWTFLQKGTFNRSIVVEETGSNSSSAFFNFDGGILQLRNGKIYRWSGETIARWQGEDKFKANAGFEYIDYKGLWSNEREPEVVRLTVKKVPNKTPWIFGIRTMKEEVQIDIAPDNLSSIPQKELSLLVLLGWFLIVISQTRSS